MSWRFGVPVAAFIDSGMAALRQERCLQALGIQHKQETDALVLKRNAFIT